MCRKATSKALRLKEYIDTIDDFDFVRPELCPYRNHIGALFTDAILQAGVNYRNAVWPRVEHVLEAFPEAGTVSAFSRVLNLYGTSHVIRWNNAEKTRRLEDLVSYCIDNYIDTADELTEYLRYEYNVESLKAIPGIGDKTCDYLKRLLGFDTVAVDRHVRAFVQRAEIACDGYYDIKEVVEFAADLMDCARRELDYSIWNYMSNRPSSVFQLTLDFKD